MEPGRMYFCLDSFAFAISGGAQQAVVALYGCNTSSPTGCRNRYVFKIVIKILYDTRIGDEVGESTKISTSG